MLIYGRRFGLDIFYINDIHRAIVIDEGVTEIVPATDKHLYTLGLFPMGSQTSNVRTEGWVNKAAVESDARHELWLWGEY